MNASRMLSMYGSKAISKSARMHRLGATIWSVEVLFGVVNFPQTAPTIEQNIGFSVGI